MTPLFHRMCTSLSQALQSRAIWHWANWKSSVQLLKNECNCRLIDCWHYLQGPKSAHSRVVEGLDQWKQLEWSIFQMQLVAQRQFQLIDIGQWCWQISRASRWHHIQRAHGWRKGQKLALSNEWMTWIPVLLSAREIISFHRLGLSKEGRKSSVQSMFQDWILQWPDFPIKLPLESLGHCHWHYLQSHSERSEHSDPPCCHRFFILLQQLATCLELKDFFLFQPFKSKSNKIKISELKRLLCRTGRPVW